jgi:WD40 repeat protein
MDIYERKFHNLEKKKRNKKKFLLNFLKIKKNKSSQLLSKKIITILKDPSIYERIFLDFKSWVMLSVAGFKHEYEKLLTPLAFCFLSELLENRFFIEARLFLLKFKNEFRPFFLHFAVKTRNYIFFFEKYQKKIFQFIEKIKFEIEIGNDSFRSFINFFKDKNFSEIFKFLNKKFKIKLTKKKRKNPTEKDENIRSHENNVGNVLAKEKIKIREYFKLERKNQKRSRKIFSPLYAKTTGKNCKIVRFLSKKNIFLNSFDVSYDERTVLTGWQDSSICVYDNVDQAFQKKKSIRFKNGVSSIYVTKFSLCSNFFLTGNLAGKIGLWSTKFKKFLIDYENTGGFIWDACFSKYNQFFATGSSTNNLSLWNMENKFPVRLFLGHSSDINVVRWHPSGNLIGSGSQDSSCLIWDIRTAKFITRIRDFKGSIHSIEFSPNGFELSIAGLSKKIGFWDLRMNKFSHQIVDVGNNSSILDLAYSTNNKYFSHTAEKTKIKIIENVSLESSFEYKKKSNNKKSNIILVETKLKKIFGLRFDTKNRLLAFGVEDFI